MNPQMDADGRRLDAPGTLHHVAMRKIESADYADKNIKDKETKAIIGAAMTVHNELVKKNVTTQSTSSSALQAFPYSDAIMKRPEGPNLKHSEQLQFEIQSLQFVLFLCFLPLR